MYNFDFLHIKFQLKLVGTLQKAEWDAKMKSPVNCYRKLLGKYKLVNLELRFNIVMKSSDICYKNL